jgi:glutaredoxin
VYCNKAKALVKNLGLEYEEKKLESFDSQIKIDGELIGGYNQLVEYFNEKGKVNFKGEIIE